MSGHWRPCKIGNRLTRREFYKINIINMSNTLPPMPPKYFPFPMFPKSAFRFTYGVPLASVGMFSSLLFSFQSFGHPILKTKCPFRYFCGLDQFCGLYNGIWYKMSLPEAARHFIVHEFRVTWEYFLLLHHYAKLDIYLVL